MLSSWKTWCRLCAEEQAVLKLESVQDINAIITDMLDVSIVEIKDVPPNICEECLSFVKKLEHFKERCTQTNRLFAYLSKCSRMGYQKLDLKQTRRTFLEDVDLEVAANHLCDELITETKDFLSANPVQATQHLEEIEKVEDINEEVFYQVESLGVTSSHTEFENNGTDTEQWEMLEVEMDGYSNEMELKDENVEDEYEKDSNSDHYDLNEPEIARESRKQHNDDAAENSPNNESVPSKHHNTRLSSSRSSQQQVFQCKVCKKKYNSSSYLKRHEVIHLSEDERHRLTCTICNKLFNKSANLKAHMQQVHEGVNPFICEECGKPFSSKGALKEHYIVHTDDRPYQCAYCSKQFKNAARLKIHEDTHNDTLYVCPHCGLKLNTKRTLNMHMVVHSDQKKFKCQECGNEYKRSKALKAHLILHTGLRPYQCPFCDKTFANGSNCRSHKKKFHPRELAALEAAGGQKPAANIPKLEHLLRKYACCNAFEV
ncbi:zinc finger protein 675-like [Anopheles maculipalpis]|uniref:zinc finger protein 675-like n=1 Tax=Anopheles maculipalpis TaxID=1496333 RepID=UPI0021594BFC|nr:zinc finger protein 675-like [Anopheles maculipalpis]